MSVTGAIKQAALDIGFDLAGCTSANPDPHADSFDAWLADGYHASMDWMARSPEDRKDTRRILPEAKSVLVVGVSYAAEEPRPAYWNDPLRGRIARYAWGRDYHKQLTPMLKKLAGIIKHETGALTARYYTDTGPVLERSTAWRAGVGFIGRNSLLISPEWGSYVLLGVIITDAVLTPDEPAARQGASLPIQGTRKTASCGQCFRCQSICPTRAFTRPYVVDAGRCISYLTIEHRDVIDTELQGLMQNWIFGCDACQSVCPWVRCHARPGRARFHRYEPELHSPRLVDVLHLTEEEFKSRYRGTPVIRAKHRGFIRNVITALGNSGQRDVIGELELFTDHPDLMIAAHARTACHRLQEEFPGSTA